MEPAGRTIKILQEIRDEQRATRTEIKAMSDRVDERFVQSDARFEVIENTLKDLAEQW